jgi:hypothetical protein
MSRARRYFLSIVAIASLLLNVGQSAHAEFTAIAGWNNQLFPSYIVATATLKRDEDTEEDDETELGDKHGLLGVEIDSPGDEVTVTVTIIANDIMEESTFTGTLAEEGETYTIRPRIRYKYAALASNKQATPITVTFRVEIDEDEAEEETQTVTLRSINDCPYAVVDGEDVQNLGFMFAAYVNEQHPFADKILREALDRHAVKSFTGYQSKNPAEVYRQVFAIWDALTERDVRYSSITTTAAESDIVHCQHIRLLDETINNAQANCADGSVLFASLLRKIGIEAFLVKIPHHIYVAFALDEKKEHIVALETTLLRAAAPKEFKEIDGLAKLLGKDWINQPSYAVFCRAIDRGTSDLTKNDAKFADPNEPHYRLMSISHARQLGILPIGFRSDAQFAPVAAGK